MRVGKLVNGKVPMTYPERLLRAGAPYAKIIPGLVKSVGRFASIINSELHYSDIQFNSQITTTGTIQYLTGVATGDTDTTREGNKVLSHDIYFRFHIYKGTAAVATQVRIILVCDKETDGANPTIANILQTASPLSPLNQNFSKRFAVIYDKMITLDNVGTSNMTWKKYIRTPFHIFYDGTSNAVTDAKENQIFMLMISNESGATTEPTLEFYSRWRWYDN